MSDNPTDSVKFSDLFRVIRCLDCLQVPLRQDNDCISITTTVSDINEEIKSKVKLLDSKGYNFTQICKQLQLLYGNHVISNRRDRFTRTEFDY